MPVKKPQLTIADKWRRFGLAIVSPWAWIHLLKLINYYNYAHVLPRKRMRSSRDCQISPAATFAQGERISLGRRVLVGEGCRIWAGPSVARIEIGDDTLLGPNVLVTAASYDFRAGSPVSDQPMLEADISIGRDVWVGAGAAILMGSNIGDGAVIGANSVVRGVIPSGVVAAGTPARKIGERPLVGAAYRRDGADNAFC